MLNITAQQSAVIAAQIQKHCAHPSSLESFKNAIDEIIKNIAISTDLPRLQTVDLEILQDTLRTANKVSQLLEDIHCAFDAE